MSSESTSRLERSDMVRLLKLRVSVVALAALLALASHVSALDKYKAAYVGGTLAQFRCANEQPEGRLDFSDVSHLEFIVDRSAGERRGVRIAYASIQDLEFGQRVSRRVAVTMGAAALAGPMALLTHPKSRRHYLTITFLDEEGRNQVVILELGQDIVRSTLSAVETRSRKPVEYRDEEARKWIGQLP